MKQLIRTIKKHLKATIWSTIIFLIGLILFYGCKDSGNSSIASKIQSCQDLFNQKQWDDAIKACISAGTDETLHYAAQSYMGKSGVTLLSIIIDLSSDPSTASKTMFDKIPNSAAKRSNYNSALSIIMNDISTKNETMYLESMILSGLLIFDQVKTLISLDWSDASNDFVSCIDATCDFSPDVSADTPIDYLTFSGFGSGFYSNICNDASFDTDVINADDYAEGFNRDVTIDSCEIQPKSLLGFNKIAVDEYYTGGSTEIKDAMLPFKFYDNMDTGGNASEDVGVLGVVYFCKDSVNANYLAPTEPTSDDFKLNDCEILSYLQNPGF